MTGYNRVFLGCWVSLDEQDQLCKVSLDGSTVEVSGPSDRQIDTIFQAFEIRREGDVSSNPIVILEDPHPATVVLDPQTPPQSPPQPLEKRPRRDSYKGMAARSLRDSSPRRQGGSGRNTAEIDSLSLLHDPTSRGASRLEILSAPEPATLEEQSSRLNNHMTLADDHLLAGRSASTVRENPQLVSSAPETVPTDERADPAVSTDEFVAPLETATGQASSILLGSLPATDPQSMISSPVTYTNPLNTVETTDDSLDTVGSAQNSEISQQSLHIPGQSTQAAPAHCYGSHDPTTSLSPIKSLDPKHRTVSKETQELYLDLEAVPIMSGILQKCVKYHQETTDIHEGDCFVTTVHKGIGAIMKPPDLTGYFDRGMWTTVKQELRKEQAGLDSLHVINMWKESFRYDYVVKLAATNVQSYQRENPGSVVDPNQAETEALKELVDVISSGRSEENYRKHHRFWIFLRQIRVEGTMNEMGCAEDRMLKDGLMHILLFRTGRFNKRFFNKTKGSLRIVREWNQVYHPYTKEVQMRVLAERADDFSGSTDVRQEVVWEALNVSRSDWVNGARALNREEQQLYLSSLDCTLQPEELSSQSTKDILRFGIDGKSERNKAIYVCLVPYEGPCNGKRKFNGTPASGRVVAPCPVVPILTGDFLGVMSGQLRYTPESTYSDKAIIGPDPNLWLDFSKTTGKLSCMRSAELDREANVTLTWKAYNDQHGPNWRIEVVASKEIWPFEELVRSNSDYLRSHF